MGKNSRSETGFVPRDESVAAGEESEEREKESAALIALTFQGRCLARAAREPVWSG